MFEIGERVVYGQTGVCEITDICEKEIIKNQKKKYYVLKPFYQQNNTIYAPCDSEKIFMRYVMTKEDADELISQIPQIKQENSDKDFREEDYRRLLSGHRREDLLIITSRIYNKRRSAYANKKKLGFSDEKYFKTAEGLLYGELAVALGIELCEVEGYIKSKLGY